MLQPCYVCHVKEQPCSNLMRVRAQYHHCRVAARLHWVQYYTATRQWQNSQNSNLAVYFMPYLLLFLPLSCMHLFAFSCHLRHISRYCIKEIQQILKCIMSIQFNWYYNSQNSWLIKTYKSSVFKMSSNVKDGIPIICSLKTFQDTFQLRQILFDKSSLSKAGSEFTSKV